MASEYRKDLGLLALRLGAGAVLVTHGTQKLFGWFGGGGVVRHGRGDGGHGLPPRPALRPGRRAGRGGRRRAARPRAGHARGGSGRRRCDGRRRRRARPGGLPRHSGGFEYPALLGWTAVCLGLAGPGRLSLDDATGHCLDRPWVIATAFTASALAAAAVVTARERALAAPRQPPPLPRSEDD